MASSAINPQANRNEPWRIVIMTLLEIPRSQVVLAHSMARFHN
jgi:hypothetical protein